MVASGLAAAALLVSFDGGEGAIATGALPAAPVEAVSYTWMVLAATWAVLLHCSSWQRSRTGARRAPL
ncbi:hypothetical protein ACH9D2_18870 [Kocuria sp. M4R2S49]|uniref:hypothetical protein n=1 Tax=Kocuria rhizosphaericola TaxID=3376284 RepID=UPI0037BD9DBF